MVNDTPNIVIADDDKDDVEILTQAIDEISPDVNVTIASDGAELLKVLDEIPKPDAILMDLNMPLKSGKECLDEIRAHEEFADVPIVILSTSNAEKDIEDCLGKGANGYYVKPYTFRGMLKIATEIFSRFLRRTA